MPEVTPFEMRRLVTIRDNNLLLKQLCGPGESVYEFQNSKALLEAALALETGRIRTPSPVRSSTSESNGGQAEEGTVEGRNEGTKPAMKLSASVGIVNAKEAVDLGNAGEERKRSLRVRPQRKAPLDQAHHTSEEEGGSASDSDDDYVEGVSNDPSSVDTDCVSTEEDNQEYDGNEESSTLQRIASKRGVLKVTGERRNCRGHLWKEKPFRRQIVEEARGRSSSKKAERKSKMRTSQSENVDKDGFDSWVISSKSKNMRTPASKSIQAEISRTKHEKLSATPRATIPPKSSTRRRGKRIRGDEVEKKEISTTEIQDVGAQGSVRITEDDFWLLQTLKEKYMRPTVSEKPQHVDKAKAATSTSTKNALEFEEPGTDTMQVEDEFLKSLTKGISSHERMEAERKKRAHEKGKAKVHSLPSPTEIASDEDDLPKKATAGKVAAEEPQNHSSSDSDFERLPERLSGPWRKPPTTQHRRTEELRDDYEEGNCQRPKDYNSDEALGEERDKVSEGGHGYKRQLVIRNESPSPNNLLTSKIQMKRERQFPFQETGQTKFFPEEGIGGSELGVDANLDDDFEEEGASNHRSRAVFGSRSLSESEARVIRKRKQAHREIAIRRREAAGEKPYYIMVSPTGTTYGDGMTAWKAELNKLCRALDPSIRDIRQQPHHKIQLLKKRLTDNFEYSGVISDRFLLPLIGNAISTRRNELMNLIRADKPKPPLLNDDVWDRLKNICESANFKKKSAAMRYANSCRQNLGRAGPGGEIGVRQSLKESLGRSPDPDEVEMEMRRDKGYGGKKKIKKKASRRKALALTANGDEDNGQFNCGELEDSQSEEVDSATEKKTLKKRRAEGKDSLKEQMQLLKKLHADIEFLKSKMPATVIEPCSANEGPEVQSMIDAPPAL